MKVVGFQGNLIIYIKLTLKMATQNCLVLEKFLSLCKHQVCYSFSNRNLSVSERQNGSRPDRTFNNFRASNSVLFKTVEPLNCSVR